MCQSNWRPVPRCATWWRPSLRRSCRPTIVEERTFISVLTAGALTEAVGRGSVRSGGTDEIAAAPALGDAVATALLAFEDGIFQVYIDDEAIESLDEQVNLHEGSRLLFLRLVALAGG